MTKKYFMKDTEDELQFGDMIELDYVGEEDGVKKHTHLEVKFLPEYVDDLLEEEIIEEREVEDDLIDFSEEDALDVLEALQTTQKAVIKCDERLLALEEALSKVEQSLAKKDKQIVVLQKAIAELKKKK